MDLMIFVIIQFLNVIISTIKSILTVKGGKTTAAVINAVSYTFGAVVTKLLTQQSFGVVICVTLLTNIVGVYLAKVILEKFQKEKLWTIMTTCKIVDKDPIEKELHRRDIKYVSFLAENNRYFLNIFSHSRAESALIKEILGNFHTKSSVVVNYSDFS